MTNRQRLLQEAAEGLHKLEPVLLFLRFINLHKAVSGNVDAEVTQRLFAHELQRLRDERLVSVRHLLCGRVGEDGLRLVPHTHHLRLEPDDLGCKERHIFLHRPQPQASVLTLDLLRRRRLRGHRLTTDDVADARDFVYLRLDVRPRLIALDERLRDGVERQQVNAAL